MTKRPLNPRFNEKILAGIKTTTIRDSDWTVGRSIMVYNWSGLPYRSKQIDVAAVMVEAVNEIIISNVAGLMTYTPEPPNLHITEGFNSREELDSWFSELVKPGEQSFKFIMTLKLL